jgi:epoxide hydrolase-like predicted phosphatase
VGLFYFTSQNAQRCFPLIVKASLSRYSYFSMFGKEVRMLYIFDLGNVIVDIDFNRVLGVWSDYSRVPLANLQKSFTMGETFHQHERGQITDEVFAERLCHEMDVALSYEQFAAGWQAIFVGLRKETIGVMQKLREQGHRVVVLSNTNRLHTGFWPDEYPEVAQSADKIYLSQEMGMRKPDAEIYLKVLQEEGFSADQAVFFDDNADNIHGARALGITSIQVLDKQTIPDWFAKQG